MVIRGDLAKRRAPARLAVEDNFVEVFVFHAESFRQLLARCLELRPDDHAAKVKENDFDGHLLFFEVPFVVAFFVADFFVSAEGVVWREAVFGLVSAGVASGLGLVAPFFAVGSGATASATGVVSASGSGASCCGCAFISFSNFLRSSRQLGIAISSR